MIAMTTNRPASFIQINWILNGHIKKQFQLELLHEEIELFVFFPFCPSFDFRFFSPCVYSIILQTLIFRFFFLLFCLNFNGPLVRQSINVCEHNRNDDDCDFGIAFENENRIEWKINAYNVMHVRELVDGWLNGRKKI